MSGSVTLDNERQFSKAEVAILSLFSEKDTLSRFEQFLNIELGINRSSPSSTALFNITQLSKAKAPTLSTLAGKSRATSAESLRNALAHIVFSPSFRTTFSIPEQ